MKRIGIWAVAALLLFTVCLMAGAAEDDAVKTAEPAPESKPADAGSPPPEYKLQADDVMKIIIWGEPNLSAEHVVDPKGYINMPLLGQIYVEGLTQGELTDKIKEGLAKYLVDAKIQIAIAQFHKKKVYILGQVNRPGLYEFKTGDRIMEAIAQAGSFTDVGYLEKATLTHKSSDEAVPLNLRALFYGGEMSWNVALQDGDTIYIPEDTKNKYYVLGEVMRPSMYRLKEDVTIVDAVAVAGGPTDRANLKSACVIRGDDIETAERIEVDLAKLIKSADLTQNIALRPGDVVYVPETSKPNWREIGSIISSIVNTSYLLRIW